MIDKATGRLVARLEMVANQLLVTLPKAKDPQEFLRELGPQAVSITRISNGSPIYKVALRDASLGSISAALNQVHESAHGVVVGGPDYLGHTTSRPANYGYGYQWGLWKVNNFDFSQEPYRQFLGRYFFSCLSVINNFNIENDSSHQLPYKSYMAQIARQTDIHPPRDCFSSELGINAEEGWDVRTSAASVIVAVVDTGIRYTHNNLKNNMWHNPYPDPEIDDIYGKNFYDNNGDIMDDYYHGTHCAGIIGGENNPSLGVSGVAQKVQLMACKVGGSIGPIYK
jgi:subtilisin family serine protease